MFHKTRAFTLIELLVVIAIIAILAAILFPVFAQAKAAAKKAAALSNIKQTSLGVLLYTNDSDDVFPVSTFWESDSTGALTQTWVQRIAPYLKSVAILQSPADSGFTCTNYPTCTAEQGPGISLAANALSLTENPSGSDWSLQGVFAPWNYGWYNYNPPISTTSVTQPASVVMLAEKYSKDLKSMTNKFGADWTLEMVSSKMVPNNLFMSDNSTGTDSQGWSEYAAAEIPNGVRPEAPFPLGKRGGVTETHGGHANFSFTDGHAKSMKPVATNPDGVSRPQDNMWNAKR